MSPRCAGGIYGIGGGSLLAPILLADWALGAWLGAGGFAGSYLGARLQSRIPEASIRPLLGLLACLVAVRYVQEGVKSAPAARPAAVVH